VTTSRPTAGARHLVRITEIAFGGDGVARLEDGRVLFTPFVAVGEEAEVEIVSVKKSFAQGRLISVRVPSPDRIDPRCPYFGNCGGCRYQHLPYEVQLALKEKQLGATLRRIGQAELGEVMVNPILASPKAFEYRNRITVHLKDGAVGFHAAGGHRLVEIKRCEIAAPAVNDLLDSLAADPRRLREDGHRTLRVDRTQRFFHQANDAAAAVMLAHVVGLVDSGGGTLVDAYCGAGWFVKALRDRFKRCIGIEWDPYAIEAARRGAIDTEQYLEGDVALLLPQALTSTIAAETTVILDPPAEGLAHAVTDAVVDSRPARVIYVSCHPATLTRDLVRLKAGGFRIEAVTPIDMFPQTAEIEAVALLTRPG
jgi:23S rRNA (uracil1939-C5)-methyltransferase